MSVNLVLPAFFAGILTFLAPCTLPLVPGYLSFISGASLSSLADPDQAPAAKRKIFFNGLAFIFGFSVIFIAFGVLLGFLGGAFAPLRIWLARIGGLAVILFGLFMLNIIRLPFFERGAGGLKIPKFFERGRPLNSLALGISFGTGWTPCVGPVLASILLLATTRQTALEGGFLLAVFSLGLAMPFLALAVGIGSAAKFVSSLSGLMKYVSSIGGIFLIILGVILITNNMAWWIAKVYQWLQFINYGAILKFL